MQIQGTRASFSLLGRPKHRAFSAKKKRDEALRTAPANESSGGLGSWLDVCGCVGVSCVASFLFLLKVVGGVGSQLITDEAGVIVS